MRTVSKEIVKKRIFLIFACILIVLGVVASIGCAGKKYQVFQTTTRDSAEEIGTVHATVLPPLHFLKYQKIIQPSFEYDEKKALADVVPISLFRYEDRYSGTAADLGINLSTEVVQKTKTETVQEGTSTVSETNTETEKTGEVPTTVTKPTLEQKKTSIPSGEALSAKEPVIDPFTKYWAATALYQEVMLINKYYRDMAINTKYEPYITRVQITTLPIIKYGPYDTLVDLSFFVNGPSNCKVIPMLVTDSLESQINSLSTADVRQLSLTLKGMIDNAGFGAGISDYNEIVKMALGRDYNSLLNVTRIQDNTLRVRLGALQQPRSGYSIIPKTHTVTVLLLVDKDQASKDDCNLIVRSKYKFMHCIDGHLVKSKKTREYYIDETLNIAYKYKKVKPKKDAEKDELVVEAMTTSIANNDTTTFNKILLEIYPELKAILEYSKSEDSKAIADSSISSFEFNKLLNDKLESVLSSSNQFHINSIISLNHLPTNLTEYSLMLFDMWNEISSLLADSPDDKTVISLPKALSPADVYITKKDQNNTLFLLDDEKGTVVNLPNVGNPYLPCLKARLVLKENYSLPAKAILADESGSGLQITFESLKKWGFKIDKESFLVLSWADNGRLSSENETNNGWEFKNLVYKNPAQAPKPDFDLSHQNGGNHISLKDGDGAIWLTFKQNDKELKAKNFLEINAARIKSIEQIKPKPTNDNKIIDPDKLQILGSGQIKINFENLVKGQKIKIILKSSNGGKSQEMEFAVV